MKRILFVCVQNSCRSQMAEGFARKLSKGTVEAYSAGSKPKGKVNPSAVKVMAEVGVDISGYRSKGFHELPVKEFDWVVTMGCGDACPFFPHEQRIDWQIEDPKDKDIESFRKTRDQIKEHVNDLIQRLFFSR